MSRHLMDARVKPGHDTTHVADSILESAS